MDISSNGLPQHPHETGVITPILQIRKPRLQRVEGSAYHHLTPWAVPVGSYVSHFPLPT